MDTKVQIMDRKRHILDTVKGLRKVVTALV
jgi:hypothetical protein